MVCASCGHTCVAAGRHAVTFKLNPAWDRARTSSVGVKAIIHIASASKLLAPYLRAAYLPTYVTAVLRNNSFHIDEPALPDNPFAQAF